MEKSSCANQELDYDQVGPLAQPNCGSPLSLLCEYVMGEPSPAVARERFWAGGAN